MLNYHSYSKHNILLDKSNDNLFDYNKEIVNLYNIGFKFGRDIKGMMYSTRLVRVNLSKFNLSSENRRILRKNENLILTYKNILDIPYDWSIGKWMKDFYESKFQEKLFSIVKIKEIFTKENNFNKVLEYNINNEVIGYCICYDSTENIRPNDSDDTNLDKNIIDLDKIIHYCYPFYKIESVNTTLGIGMMTKAILYAKENDYQYIYLGGHTSAKDNYKLQFEGLEWWDNVNNVWSNDIDRLKVDNI